MAKLVCQAGPTAGHEYPLNRDKVMFGRQRTCDVQIMDSMASREHFLIRRDGNLYTLVDLESRNGTHLNERKVSERQLDFGDTIRVGAVEYLFVKETGDTDLKDLLTKKYTILEKIGEGGMGIVYKALQKSMERTVALKILAPKYSNRPRFVEQFIREARAAGALNHPNIIQVHDVASENGVHYFSMEFIDGPTAMRMISNEGRLPEAVACEIIRQTAKALAYAHDHRLIHRDIKPDNIMVTTNNTVKLADLGISKTFDEAEAEGKPKRIVGTPHYMAPEASLGNRIDHRVDIYSLGVTFYHLLSGQTPYAGTKATEVLKAHIRDTPPALDSLVPGIRPEVVDLCTAMMAKNADERMQSAEEVAQRAQNLLESLSAEPSNNRGEETVMLRRMVSATSAAYQGGDAGPTKSPTNPSTQGSQLRTPTKTREAPLRRANHSPNWILRGIVLVCGLIIALYAFSKLKEHFLKHSEEAPSNIQEPDPELTPQSGPGNSPQTATQAIEQRVSEEHRAAINRISEGLTTARSSAELAGLLEEIRTLNQVIDDPVLVTRLQSMESSAQQRLQNALANQERGEFDRLAADIDRLLEAGDFAAASSRLDSFAIPENSPLRKRQDYLRQRIDDEKTRQINTLSKRWERLTSAKDIAGLRALRSNLPAVMLDNPLAQQINESIRSLEQEQQQRHLKLINEGRQALLAMDLDNLALHVRQSLAADSSEEFNNELIALRDNAQAVDQAINALNQHLQEQRRPLRYRGTINGINNPDLTGANRSGLSLGMPSGGQMAVPWRDIQPALLIELLDMATSATTEADGALAETVIPPFRRWAELTATQRN